MVAQEQAGVVVVVVVVVGPCGHFRGMLQPSI